MVILALLGGALGGCGGEPAATPAKAEKAKALLPGEFEISSEVTALRSADASTPATKAKLGDKQVYKACVAADGTLSPEMFVDKGDKCSVTNSYVRSGRLSIQYQCNRAGKGTLYPNADGDFKADGFEALVNVSTQFSGTGDYRLTRKLVAKRVGDCPAAGVAG
jgi:hypothetical protein